MIKIAELEGQTIEGELSMFDRIIFKGHLNGLYARKDFTWFLRSQGVKLSEFGTYAERVTAELKAHMQQLCQAEQRPYLYLNSGKGPRGESKEELAQGYAAKDGITEGLICVLATLEMNNTFDTRGDAEQQKQKRVVTRPRKCLHFYVYYMDCEFGFMHVRVQSWLPLEMQVYINGREWLARQLDQAGIAYVKRENSFTQIDDLVQAQALCDKFAHRQWSRVLDAFALRLNPVLPRIQESINKGYYWVVNQCEVATDLLFADDTLLQALAPELMQQALALFAAQDAMRFLGRKLNGNFQGEIQSNLKQRQEGWRVKHWVKNNSLKLYNRPHVLRIETTINNSYEFNIQVQETDGSWRWQRLKKGVSHFWHFYQVGCQANQRYLDALRHLTLQGKDAIQILDALCQSHLVDGKRIAKFNPVSQDDSAIFIAVLNGAHLLSGFRNKDLTAQLYPTPASSPQEATRRCARISRLIAKLRGHGLVVKIERTNLYQVTQAGFAALSAALAFRNWHFPHAFCLP